MYGSGEVCRNPYDTNALAPAPGDLPAVQHLALAHRVEAVVQIGGHAAVQGNGGIHSHRCQPFLRPPPEGGEPARRSHSSHLQELSHGRGKVPRGEPLSETRREEGNAGGAVRNRGLSQPCHRQPALHGGRGPFQLDQRREGELLGPLRFGAQPRRHPRQVGYQRGGERGDHLRFGRPERIHRTRTSTPGSGAGAAPTAPSPP